MNEIEHQNLLDAAEALAGECCQALKGKGIHSGDWETCSAPRCSRMREVIEPLAEWEPCLGIHRQRRGRWERRKGAHDRRS
jgi:hypothetical protein